MRRHQRHTLNMYYYTKLLVHLCELIIVSLGLQLIRNISDNISVENQEVLSYVGIKLQDWTLVDILRYLLIFRLIAGGVWICDTFFEILKTAGMQHSYSNTKIHRAKYVLYTIDTCVSGLSTHIINQVSANIELENQNVIAFIGITDETFARLSILQFFLMWRVISCVWWIAESIWKSINIKYQNYRTIDNDSYVSLENVYVCPSLGNNQNDNDTHSSQNNSISQNNVCPSLGNNQNDNDTQSSQNNSIMQNNDNSSQNKQYYENSGFSHDNSGFSTMGEPVFESTLIDGTSYNDKSQDLDMSDNVDQGNYVKDNDNSQDLDMSDNVDQGNHVKDNDNSQDKKRPNRIKFPNSLYPRETYQLDFDSSDSFM